MKRRMTYLQSLYLFLTGFLFVSWIAGLVFDYDVTLHLPQGYTWTAAICAAAMVLILCYETKRQGRSEPNKSPLCLPFASLYGVSLLWLARWEKVIIPVLISLICAVYLFRHTVQQNRLRLICKLLSFVIITLYLLFLPGFIIMSDFGKTTIVQSFDSPDGRYQALLVDIDQGALGGNTDVYVEDKEKSYHLGVISYQKKKLVYRTGWGEYEDMVLTWEDHDTLLIDGQPYSVPDL